MEEDGRRGFLCPWPPEAYGGSGVDFEYSVVIGQELIRGDATGIGVQNHQDVEVPYIYSFGSEEPKRKILPKAASGDIVCCLRVTEIPQ